MSAVALPGQAKPSCDNDLCTAFICPFCRKRCEAHIHGDLETGEFFMLHVEPICQKYDTMEPDDFMHAVNIQYGGHN